MDKYSLSFSIKIYCVEYWTNDIFSKPRSREEQDKLSLSLCRNSGPEAPWFEGVVMCKHHCSIHISAAILSSKYTRIKTQYKNKPDCNEDANLSGRATSFLTERSWFMIFQSAISYLNFVVVSLLLKGHNLICCKMVHLHWFAVVEKQAWNIHVCFVHPWIFPFRLTLVH